MTKVTEITYNIKGKVHRIILSYPRQISTPLGRKRVTGSVVFFDWKGRKLLTRIGLSSVQLRAIEKQVKKKQKVITIARR